MKEFLDLFEWVRFGDHDQPEFPQPYFPTDAHATSALSIPWEGHEPIKHDDEKCVRVPMYLSSGPDELAMDAARLVLAAGRAHGEPVLNTLQPGVLSRRFFGQWERSVTCSAGLSHITDVFLHCEALIEANAVERATYHVIDPVSWERLVGPLNDRLVIGVRRKINDSFVMPYRKNQRGLTILDRTRVVLGYF